MKKIIFLLLITGSVFADGFYSAGSFSYDPMHVQEDVPEGLFFRTSVTVGVEYFGFYAEAEQNTDMIKSDMHMFSPFNAEYYARGGFVFKQFFVEYEHLCIHGIDNYNPQGGHDRITIGFDTRLNEKTNNTGTRRN